MNHMSSAISVGDTVVPELSDDKSYWTFQDMRGFQKSIPASILRAKSKAWGDAGGTRIDQLADLRNLLLASAVNMDFLSNVAANQVVLDGAPATVFTTRTQDQFDNVNYYACAQAPLRAWEVLAKKVFLDNPDLSKGIPKHAGFIDGNPGVNLDEIIVGPPTTGGWQLVVGLAAVVGLTAIAWRAESIWEKSLIADDAARNLMANVGKTLEIGNNHAQAEKEAGKPLVWNAAEIAAIQQLNKATDTYADAYKVAAQPVPAGFPILDAIPPLIKGTVDTAKMLAVGLAVVGGVVLLTQLKKTA